MNHFPNHCIIETSKLYIGLNLPQYNLLIEQDEKNSVTIPTKSKHEARCISKLLVANGVRYIGVYCKIDGQLVEVAE